MARTEKGSLWVYVKFLHGFMSGWSKDLELVEKGL